MTCQIWKSICTRNFWFHIVFVMSQTNVSNLTTPIRIFFSLARFATLTRLRDRWQNAILAQIFHVFAAEHPEEISGGEYKDLEPFWLNHMLSHFIIENYMNVKWKICELKTVPILSPSLFKNGKGGADHSQGCVLDVEASIIHGSDHFECRATSTFLSATLR